VLAQRSGQLFITNQSFAALMPRANRYLRIALSRERAVTPSHGASGGECIIGANFLVVFYSNCTGCHSEMLLFSRFDYATDNG